jgi:rubrerythrin
LSNPIKPTEVGENRTGIATSPLGFETFRALEGRIDMPDAEALEEMRLSYCTESEPVGTMPAPANIKGAVKNAIAAAKGESAAVLLDKLGERLAFERTGVRLYDALIVKLEASHTHDETVTRDALEEIRDDELRHAGLIASAIQRLGGDPTVVTPCADVAGVAGGGFAQVLTDAKTTFTQCLGTMLMVEAADLAAWELLIELVEQLGYEDLGEQFRECADEEDRHESKLTEWVRTAVLGQADFREDPQTEH